MVRAPKDPHQPSSISPSYYRGYLQTRQVLFPGDSLNPSTITWHTIRNLYCSSDLSFACGHQGLRANTPTLSSVQDKCVISGILCSSLSERRQLLQSYLSVGSLFPPALRGEQGMESHARSYNADIQNVTEHFGFNSDGTTAASKIVFKGTEYKTGLFFALDKNDDGIIFGGIQLILVKDGTEVFFVAEKCQSVPLVELGVHAIMTKNPGEKTPLVCIKANDLPGYYPSPAYTFRNMSVISLRHSVTTEEDECD